MAILVLGVCIFLLNAPIIISIVVFRKLHTKQDLLIANQAVSDLLVGIISIPLLLLHMSIVGDKYGCIGVLMANHFPYLGSLSNLLILAVDRYVAVTHPFSYVNYTRCDTLKVIFGVWIFSILWTCMCSVCVECGRRDCVFQR